MENSQDSVPVPVAQPTINNLTPEQQIYIKKASFAAFILGPIYFFANHLVVEGLLEMFVPIYGFYLYIKSIFKGREMTWNNGGWASFEAFQKRQKTLNIIAFVFIGIFILMFGAMVVIISRSIPSKQSQTEPSNTNNMTRLAQLNLRQFFPALSGNVGDYKVSLPEDYVNYTVPENLGPGTYLWGTSEDIKVITASPDSISFEKAKAGIFRVRFSKNVALGENGEISDGSGSALSKESYEAQGVTNVNFEKGFFGGIKALPVVVVSGQLNGNNVFIAYLYSPVDNLVMMVNLQGGDAQQDMVLWNNFIKSRGIK